MKTQGERHVDVEGWTDAFASQGTLEAARARRKAGMDPSQHLDFTLPTSKTVR